MKKVYETDAKEAIKIMAEEDLVSGGNRYICSSLLWICI